MQWQKMGSSSFAALAPVSVVLLIAFLAYASQWAIHHSQLVAMSNTQTLVFNVLLGCLWTAYARTCWTHAGLVPVNYSAPSPSGSGDDDGPQVAVSNRWCKKCEASKPPRAHHCRACQRCIPKMDHHCPWTMNCVSHRTFPHFIRFLIFAVVSMSSLQYFLYLQFQVLWDKRTMPSYLGPSLSGLTTLFLVLIVNTVTLTAVGIIAMRALWTLAFNVTTIESWEIERHAALVRRASKQGGLVAGPEGIQVRIIAQEFPYDIGIWSNIQQAMGSNPLTWLLPFASTLPNASGLVFEVNGFEDPDVAWPPPDPERMPRRPRPKLEESEFVHADEGKSDRDRIQAFRQRQAIDLNRACTRHDIGDSSALASGGPTTSSQTPLHRWRNEEGEELEDCGVDDAEDERY